MKEEKESRKTITKIAVKMSGIIMSRTTIRMLVSSLFLFMMATTTTTMISIPGEGQERRVGSGSGFILFADAVVPPIPTATAAAKAIIRRNIISGAAIFTVGDIAAQMLTMPSSSSKSKTKTTAATTTTTTTTSASSPPSTVGNTSKKKIVKIKTSSLTIPAIIPTATDTDSCNDSDIDTESDTDTDTEDSGQNNEKKTTTTSEFTMKTKTTAKIPTIRRTTSKILILLQKFIHLDINRLLISTILGGLWSGYVVPFVYGNVELYYPGKTSIKQILLKVGITCSILSTVGNYLTMFIRRFVTLYIMYQFNTQSSIRLKWFSKPYESILLFVAIFKGCFKSCNSDIIEIIIDDLKIWPLYDLTCYSIISPYWRPITTSIMSSGWAIYMSIISAKDNNNNHNNNKETDNEDDPPTTADPSTIITAKKSTEPGTAGSSTASSTATAIPINKSVLPSSSSSSSSSSFQSHPTAAAVEAAATTGVNDTKNDTKNNKYNDGGPSATLSSGSGSSFPSSASKISSPPLVSVSSSA